MANRPILKPNDLKYFSLNWKTQTSLLWGNDKLGLGYLYPTELINVLHWSEGIYEREDSEICGDFSIQFASGGLCSLCE